MIDILVLGVPLLVWLAAFLAIHIAVWIGEELSYRRDVKRTWEHYSDEHGRGGEPDDED